MPEHFLYQPAKAAVNYFAIVERIISSQQAGACLLN
jgi:hypothetical protein